MDQDKCTGRGCLDTIDAEVPFCNCKGCNKLDVTDYLDDIPAGYQNGEYVEVRFKNTRKGVFRNVNNIQLREGDIVAVEASPGHDIGVVSLTGDLVPRQMIRQNIPLTNPEPRKIYRKAKPADIEKWKKAVDQEYKTMLRARKISEDLRLDMKIGDVEYQGDGTKAIFYYIADERVDFRGLIKLLADEFRIRVEMKQIGARQEAGRIGGIGACGRELCCASHLTNFVSVSTTAARYQEVSLNPQKLAGQCGKLKCCLNYELDVYLDAIKDFPDTSIAIETEAGRAIHQKTDVFKELMWYAVQKESSSELVCLTVDRVKELIALNKRGEKVKKIESVVSGDLTPLPDYLNSAGEDSITRFDNKNVPRDKKRRRKNRKGKKGGPQN